MTERRTCCAKCTRAGHVDLLQCAMHHSDSSARMLWVSAGLLVLAAVLLLVF